MVDMWSKFSQSVDGRDKSLKATFYGSKMLLAYLEPNGLTPERREMLTLLMSTSSIARKAFRLLKSFTHISSALKVIASQGEKFVEGDVESVVEILQHTMWVSSVKNNCTIFDVIIIFSMYTGNMLLL